MFFVQHKKFGSVHQFLEEVFPRISYYSQTIKARGSGMVSNKSFEFIDFESPMFLNSRLKNMQPE